MAVSYDRPLASSLLLLTEEIHHHGDSVALFIVLKLIRY